MKRALLGVAPEVLVSNEQAIPGVEKRLKALFGNLVEMHDRILDDMFEIEYGPNLNILLRSWSVALKDGGNAIAYAVAEFGDTAQSTG